MRPWVAFFSQTGTEIHNLSNEIGVYPDAIITNNPTISKINSALRYVTEFRTNKLNREILHTLTSKPTVEEYENILSKFKNPILTLHGYLRIIPKQICEKYETYNLHPGLIDKYPELKGFNPQERAYRDNYKLAGCVIHKVTPEVDEGEILMSQGISIEGLTLNEVYEKLHDTAFDLWKSFFSAYNVLKG